MKNIMRQAVLSLSVVLLFWGTQVSAVSMTLEQKYQDVFVSAGYATAMGAGVGAALLAFKEDPSDHLRYVAIGASIGFFAGTAFGTYMVVAPSFADESHKGTTDFAAAGAKERQLVVQPVIRKKDWSLSGVEAGIVLAKF